jgi:hypothetical protein
MALSVTSVAVVLAEPRWQPRHAQLDLVEGQLVRAELRMHGPATLL